MRLTLPIPAALLIGFLLAVSPLAAQTPGITRGGLNLQPPTPAPIPKPTPVIPSTPATATPTPATPTSAPNSTVQDIPPAATAAPATPPQPAQISYNAGRLTVVANNSSLTEILHQISNASGVKIVGSIPDSRVYGTYGPASPADLFEALLDGSNSNFVFSHINGAVGELTLTSRNGEVVTPLSGTPAISPGSSYPAQPQRPPQNQPAALPPLPPFPRGPLTPQQIADRLALMHQRQMQQQGTAPQN